MNEVFTSAANQFRQKLPQFSRKVEVSRLYRKSLKLLASWAIDRDIFIDEADKIRARFDAGKDASDAKAIRLIKEAKDEIFKNTHPDPYCIPFMPGGSLFMRNPPIPLEVCFPDGNYPADAPKILFNPDMSICKEDTGKNAVGTVLVDFTKKNME
mmetsp:Transcript_12643/g.18438  ORF Transcript_12643/g.18438 Transcript_12643/m.18438 type:complete len:155 (-) Transcript_12643:755-1219(-)|eukprot:CAMPEP_0197234768 /NCGR_PEP_ID=MMETSP1429-20130617/2430_1 /TAXON_ID=49237 /ORGANISM="Chaetoceros  sp., Strain UNC1202" /LENGTH=154 /DNA_ID=CAMNT_0042693255 /DNA_START=91 /DNA_END=555 /DNA_ORIENTATION=+